MPVKNGRGCETEKSASNVRQFARLVRMLSGVIEQLGSIASNSITKSDLAKLERKLTMRLTEVKATIAAAAAKNREAFQELGTKIGELNAKIQELLDQASDPEITDETFLANLQEVKTTGEALAAIVPNSEPPESTAVES